MGRLSWPARRVTGLFLAVTVPVLDALDARQDVRHDGLCCPPYLYYYQEMMAGLRGAIEAGKLAEFIATFEAGQAEGDLEPI